MSFLSVLKSIGSVTAGVTNAIAPFAPYIAAIPTVGPVANTVLSAVMSAEHLITVAGSGAVKKSLVEAIVNAQHPGVDKNSVSSIIDKVVAAMNALAAALDAVPAQKQAA